MKVTLKNEKRNKFEETSLVFGVRCVYAWDSLLTVLRDCYNDAEITRNPVLTSCSISSEWNVDLMPSEREPLNSYHSIRSNRFIFVHNILYIYLQRSCQHALRIAYSARERYHKHCRIARTHFIFAVNRTTPVSSLPQVDILPRPYSDKTVSICIPNAIVRFRI